MKYYIAAATAGLIAFGLLLNQDNDQSTKTKWPFYESVAPEQPLDPASTAVKLGIQPGPTQLQEISKKIEELTEEAAKLDHELQVAGYPKVMLDDRLSESEKTELLDKVLKASSIHNQIALLKIRRIDLKAEL